MSENQEGLSPLSEKKKRKKYVYLDKFEQYKTDAVKAFAALVNDHKQTKKIAISALVVGVTALVLVAAALFGK